MAGGDAASRWPRRRLRADAAAADQPRRSAQRRERTGGSGCSWRPFQPGLARRRRGASARSRCRAPPGSPTTCRARRRRSAAALGVVVEPAALRRSWSGRPPAAQLEAGHEARRGCRHACRCRRSSRRRRTAPGRCATRPASGRSPRAASVSQSCGYSTCTTRISPSAPVGHHLARLPHHRIAGVVVRQREDACRLRRPAPASVLASASVGGQRLVADHVDAGVEERLGRRRSACGWA